MSVSHSTRDMALTKHNTLQVPTLPQGRSHISLAHSPVFVVTAAFLLSRFGVAIVFSCACCTLDFHIVQRSFVFALLFATDMAAPKHDLFHMYYDDRRAVRIITIKILHNQQEDILASLPLRDNHEALSNSVPNPLHPRPFGHNG